MDENKEKEELNDEHLEQVNGGEWGWIPLLRCSNCSYVGDRYPAGSECPSCHNGYLR
ncbi:MAG: hypothetical protein IKR93_04920 [Firmicutes bacterium]|nr:hypothetical protein [Bacillota bacterium]